MKLELTVYRVTLHTTTNTLSLQVDASFGDGVIELTVPWQSNIHYDSDNLEYLKSYLLEFGIVELDKENVYIY